MSSVSNNIFVCCPEATAFNSILPNVKNLLELNRANSQDELSYDQVIEILDCNNLAPLVSYSSYTTQSSSSDFSLARAVSESIFGSSRYSEFVILKCLKYLKNVSSQKKSEQL
jgi:hypothetical protein